MKIDKIMNFFLVPSGLLLLALIFHYSGRFNRLLFPNPFLVIKAFVLAIFSSEIQRNLGLTLSRVFISLIISVLLGIPVGLILGYYTRVYDAFEFSLDFFRSIPVTAIFPLFLLFFGVGDYSKIMMGMWLATLIIIIGTTSGVRYASRAYTDLARVYRLSKKYVITDIIFPGALPGIFSGIRVGVSLVLIVVIVSEMFIGSVNGLGHLILDAQLSYDISQMYALIIMTGVIGFGFNKIFLILEKRVLHWTRNV